jgi:predicted nucleic acid-binding protein
MGRAVKYLLDSVILIDHFNGIEAATAFMAEHGGNCAISVITRAEVLTGFSVRTERLARDLLDRFRTLPVTADVADLAASLRRKEHWKLPDALQVALAIRHELTLVTRNTRDFSSSRKMPVLVPYRV